MGYLPTFYFETEEIDRNKIFAFQIDLKKNNMTKVFEQSIINLEKLHQNKRITNYSFTVEEKNDMNKQITTVEEFKTYQKEILDYLKIKTNELKNLEYKIIKPLSLEKK